MKTFFQQSNLCYRYLRMPQTIVFGFIVLETRGGNFVVVFIFTGMAQMVWYILILILFIGLGAIISDSPCVWRGNKTMVSWKVFVITSSSFLNYVTSISITFGNFLPRMGMIHGFQVILIMFTLHAKSEPYHSEFKVPWKTLRRERIQAFRWGQVY